MPYIKCLGFLKIFELLAAAEGRQRKVYTDKISLNFS